MIETIQELKMKFEGIKAMEWIPAPHNLYNENGTLFESLLDKDIENFEIPDYDGIEIKTHQRKSLRYMTLFNANPEGVEFFEINRLCEKYGYPDAQLKETNVLSGEVTTICSKKLGGSIYNFLLSINKNEQRIYLDVYDFNGKLVDHGSYWMFSTLEEKLNRKLAYLAYIDVEMKREKGQIYFCYTDIHFYRLKGFNEFLSAIEEGKIKIVFSVGVFRKGKRKGQIHNHGVAFKINPQYLNVVFEEIIL